MAPSSQNLMEEPFQFLSRDLIRNARGLSAAVESRRFRALFGVSPKARSTVWILILASAPQSFQPAHLLWGLMLLKARASEHDNAALSGADEKGSRKRSWKTIRAIADLQVARFSYSILRCFRAL